MVIKAKAKTAMSKNANLSKENSVMGGRRLAVPRNAPIPLHNINAVATAVSKHAVNPTESHSKMEKRFIATRMTSDHMQKGNAAANAPKTDRRKIKLNEREIVVPQHHGNITRVKIIDMGEGKPRKISFE